MRTLSHMLLALMHSAVSGKDRDAIAAMTPRYRQSAPALGRQTINAMPRRARRSVWRDALKRNKTTKANLPWHASGLTLDGQHARVAA